MFMLLRHLSKSLPVPTYLQKCFPPPPLTRTKFRFLPENLYKNIILEYLIKLPKNIYSLKVWILEICEGNDPHWRVISPHEMTLSERVISSHEGRRPEGEEITPRRGSFYGEIARQGGSFSTKN